MKLRTRIFLKALPIWINIEYLKAKSRRHNNMPDYYKRFERNEFFLKTSTKILKHLNVKVNVKGLENVPNTSCLLLPNHSTYLDPLIMAWAVYNHGDNEITSRQIAFIAREEVNRKSVKTIAPLIDTYFINTEKPREALNTLKDFGTFVKQNQVCGVIFPEGTRTKDGKLGTFNSGAIRLAQSMYLPIVPVTINNAANGLDKNRNGILEVEVVFHPILKPMSFSTLDAKTVTELVKEKIASVYKDQEITSNETVKNCFTKRKAK